MNIDIDKTFLEILISKFNCKLVFKFFSHYPQTQMNLIMKTLKIFESGLISYLFCSTFIILFFVILLYTMTILFICSRFLVTILSTLTIQNFYHIFFYTHVVPNSQSLTPNHRLYSNSCIEMIYCGWLVEITLEEIQNLHYTIL